MVVCDIAVFVLKRDIKLQPTCVNGNEVQRVLMAEAVHFSPPPQDECYDLPRTIGRSEI